MTFAVWRHQADRIVKHDRSGAVVLDVEPGVRLAGVLGGEGARNPRTSCNLLIFVVEAAEPVVSFDLVDLGWRAVGERP